MWGESREHLGVATRWVLVALLLVVGAVAVWLVRDILLLVLASVILTVWIGTPIRFFVRHGLGRPLAVALSLLLITVVIVLAIVLLVPGLLQQFATLAGLIPRAVEQLQELIDSGQLAAQFPWLGQILEQVNIDITMLGPIIDQIGGALGQITQAVFPFVGGVASTLLSLLVVLFMTVYFVISPDDYREGLLKLVPPAYRLRAGEIVLRLELTLRGFLQAKMLSMILIGFGTFIGLTLLGVPLAPALGTLNGLFSFVPNFGPLAALVPTLAVTIVNAPDRWLWVVVLIYGLQLIESQFVGPWLMSERINLSPVLVLVGQIIAGIFFGFLGLLLAVPLVAILVVLVQEVYIRDILGDAEGMPPAP